MDLFGTKAKKEVLALRRSLLEAQVDLVLEKASNRRSKQQLMDADVVIKKLAAENMKLREDLIQAKAPAQFSQHPLYFNESEEDLEWQLRQGLIDTTEYKDALAQLGFDNAEIEIASEYADADHSNLSY